MITLVLGGARSGKSALAERLVSELPGPTTYVATLVTGAGTDDDHDVVARIAAHRARRPAAWRTVEAGLDLPDHLRATVGSVLLDSLGPWVALHDGRAADGPALCRALAERQGDTVIVSEEVGSGVHPSSAAGRVFRDDLGRLNQEVAALADRVLLVVAGRVLPLEKWR